MFEISNALSELFNKKGKPEASYSITNNDYSTLIWNSSEPKPTLKELETKRDQMQADYDAKQYQRDRAQAYPELKEQLDLLWHAIDGGKFNVKSKDTDFYKKLKAVKDANPKPE
jgi:hypothetical protein